MKSGKQSVQSDMLLILQNSGQNHLGCFPHGFNNDGIELVNYLLTAPGFLTQQHVLVDSTHLKKVFVKFPQGLGRNHQLS